MADAGLKCDVMAFGPHPDDIELGCGGTLIKLADLGHATVLVDLTRGEMGTRGTVETRAEEAAAAAEILGAEARENIGLPVFVPYYQDRHPDHYHASELIYEGLFTAGLARYETSQESYRPSKVAYYMRWHEFEPTFIVDISAQFERKMEAVWAYSSQFKPDDVSFEQTRLTTPVYHWKLVHRMAYYGSLIQRQYGEGFLIRGKLEMDDPLEARFLSF
jgi:LmbE family N-acetylglucosaminyl deacetylase